MHASGCLLSKTAMCHDPTHVEIWTLFILSIELWIWLNRFIGIWWSQNRHSVLMFIITFDLAFLGSMWTMFVLLFWLYGCNGLVCLVSADNHWITLYPNGSILTLWGGWLDPQSLPCPHFIYSNAGLGTKWILICGLLLWNKTSHKAQVSHFGTFGCNHLDPLLYCQLNALLCQSKPALH